MRIKNEVLFWTNTKSFVLILFTSFAIISTIKAQDGGSKQISNQEDTPERENYLSIYPELLGNGILFSINAEYVWKSRTSSYLFTRIGLGFPGLDYVEPTAILEFGYIVGKGNNFLDLSIGYSHSLLTYKYDNSTPLLFPVRIGYRYMNEDTIFRISPVLFFAKDHELIGRGDQKIDMTLFAGLSIGVVLK